MCVYKQHTLICECNDLHSGKKLASCNYQTLKVFPWHVVQVNVAMDSKAEQVREILDMSEQLQGSLSTLNREKDLLATSLRQEAAYNQQLVEEKVWMTSL